MNWRLTLKLVQLKGPYRGIITLCFKVAAFSSPKVQAAFYRRLDCFILRDSFHDMVKNETARHIIILVTS